MIEQAIELLSNHPDYRLLRRVPEPPNIAPEGLVKKGLVLDCETTGWDFKVEKVINFSGILFEYSPITGKIFRCNKVYEGYEDPCRSIDPKIVQLTGITDEKLKDQKFADDEVNSLAEEADLVIAHHAGFDRKFVENRFPAFEDTNWSCSINSVDWKDGECISSQTLSFLLFSFGYFYTAHRALDDCFALLHLLQQTTPLTQQNVMKLVSAAARKRTVQVCACGAPYEMKDTLKMEGFRWAGDEGRHKAWVKTVPSDEEGTVMEWLDKNVYGRKNLAQVTYLTAKERFSAREGV